MWRAKSGVWNWLAQHLIAQGVPESRALNILSLGFALGLLLGRVVVSQVLKTVKAEEVTLVAAILMAMTTLIMLQARGSTAAWIAVFFAGVAMSPVFPTVLAMVGGSVSDDDRDRTGLAISAGWLGLAVSSRIIGSIAGGDPQEIEEGAVGAPGGIGGDDRGESRAAGAVTWRKRSLPSLEARP